MLPRRHAGSRLWNVHVTVRTHPRSTAPSAHARASPTTHGTWLRWSTIAAAEGAPGTVAAVRACASHPDVTLTACVAGS